MKKVILFMGLLTLSLISYSQAGLWWKTDGSNIVDSNAAVGTSNNEPLRFKANGTEWMSISPNGIYTLNGLSSITDGFAILKTNGELYKIDFTGNNNDVFLGDGTFGSVSSVTGWNFTGANLTTTYNVGIGTTLTPEKLTVNGNILANGSISGTSLNVVDIVTSGKQFKISTSICLTGVDANDPNSRNELCGMNGDLFIQSETNNNYNTIFNKGNNGKVGFGVIPTTDFHVGKDALFDAGVNFSSLSINPNVNELLTIDATGKVLRSGDMEPIATSVYNIGCKTDSNGDIYPFWRNGPYKITTGGDPNCNDDILVGINTTNPTSSLHVVGNAHVTGTLRVGLSSIFLGGVDQLTGNNNTIYSTTSDLLIQSDAANSFNTILNANNNGNVGIGMSAPAYKLEVAGTVRACKFIAEANSWCDYVFDEIYSLMSIEELEIYLKTKRHLRWLPSEKEIAEKGVDLVEVTTGILHQTEDNTLYIIQLEKEIKDKDARIIELEKEKAVNDEWKKMVEERLNEVEGK